MDHHTTRMGDMQKHTLVLSDESHVTVTRTSTFDSDPRYYNTSRRRYTYLVRDGAGQLVMFGYDLHGPVFGAAPCPSARTMTGTLLAFMVSAAEHYANRGMGGEGYEPHFVTAADEWCYMHDEELWLAREEIEGERS